jgi:precorrin-3B synthase
MSTGRRILPDASNRRGWCPSLLRPMPTGDGLLVRVHPPLGRLTGLQARAVAQGARHFGNGHIDVPARANLQIRGVTPETQGPLAASLEAVGLGDVRDDGSVQRLTLTAPLAGPAIAILAEAVEATGRAIAGLPAKTLVTIEDGSRFGLAGAEADVMLRLVDPDRIAWALATQDGPAWFAAVPTAQVLRHLTESLHALAASGARRMRDLDVDTLARLAADGVAMAPPPLAPALEPGLHDFGGDRLVLALDTAFGRCSADGLDSLAAWSDAIGAPDLRLSPTRGFVLMGTDSEGARRAWDALGAQGFVHAADDPRGGVAACPGAPACASGTTPTLGDAARLAEALRPLISAGLTAHVSGCAKGCAHPAAAALTLVGHHGLYDVVLDGRPDAVPAMRLTFEAALDRVRSADSALPFEHAFRTPPR